ncbi:ROK family transcriptional regulator [Evansella tamaricis]|nr:ROK family transcriptional regulator [Evansella tamaricis]
MNVPHKLRVMNKSLVLNIVREHGRISRAQIASKTNLTRASVSQIVNDLLEDNVIYEAGTENSALGRKGIGLEFNRSYGYTLGVDLGGTKISLGLFDFNGDIMEKETFPTYEVDNSNEFIHLLGNSLLKFMRKHKVADEKLLAIGIASPGIIDYKNGIVVEGSPNLPEWDSLNLSKEIEKIFDVPTFVENDVRSALIGEFWKGKCQGVKSAVLLSLGTGVGSALLIDGHIIRGAGNGAGEVGYFLFNREQLNQDWGKEGCLESLISGSGLPKQYDKRRQMEQSKSNTSPSDGNKDPKSNHEQVTAKQIFQMAKEGEPIAEELVDEFIDYLCLTILNLIVTVNPEKIVLTGGLSRSADVFLEKVKEKVNRHTFTQHAVDLEVSNLFDDAALSGIAILSLNSLLPDINFMQDIKIR